MLARAVLVALALLALPARAGSGELTPRDVLATVLSVVRADWDGDGLLDRAVLWQPQGGGELASLFVFTSQGKVYQLVGAAWSRLGDLEAWLESAPDGFRVVSGGLAGGERWREALAVGFTQGEPRVAGYEYRSYDPAAPAKGFVCSADFAAGRGERNGESFAISGGAVPLGKWSFSRIPAPCKAR